ncbi:MAG: hypothetical protein J1E05_02965 [Eubacterium sp.]|nr:hypothetical protein [Eubacterium sp.]
MDMKISGTGVITPGEYDNVKISGSANVTGYIRCLSYHCAGSSHANDNIECENEMEIAGSCKFDKNITAGNLSIAGSTSCSGDITVKEKMSTAGAFKCGGSIKAGTLSIAGAGNLSGDAEAELIKIGGKLDCDGLLNAEEIEIKFESGMQIGSIGGSRISIYPKKSKRKAKLPLFSSLIRSSSTVRVSNSIEGDVIALEGVVTPRVSGRIVAISDGCEIDLVQYSEQIEISPNAKVGKTEKI